MRDRIARIGWRWLAAVLVLTAVAPAAARAQAPGSKLTVGVPLIAESFDARTPSSSAFITLNAVHERLFSIDDKGKYRPALAESWKLVNPNTWQFKLRKGLRFHNGDELTAQDVKFSVDFVLDPNNRHPNRTRFTDITEAVVVDKHTVNLVTKEPSGALLSNIFRLYILPGHLIKTKGLDEFNKSFVGLGPFKLKSYSPGDRLVLTANKEYWAGAPKIEELTFRAIPEHATRMAAAEAGELDIAWFVPPEHVDRLKGKGLGITVVSTNQSRAVGLGTQATRIKPLEDKRVRQALNYALDKEGINAFLFGGLSRVADGQPIGPAAFGYNPALKPYPYDPAKAKQLLAEAGYPNGFSTTFEFPVGRYLKDKEYAEVLAAQLGAVGVKVELKPLESGVWLQKYTAGTIGTLFMTDLGPSIDLDFATARFPSWGQSKFWANERFDAAFKKQRATVDQSERLKVLQEMAAIFRDEAPIIFGLEITAIHAVSPRVTGVVFPADGTVDLSKASVK